MNILGVSTYKVINNKKGKRKMSDKKTQKKSNKNGKCKIKCRNCQFYDREDDYCIEKGIENCTRQNMNFSKCDSYLIRDDLVMF